MADDYQYSLGDRPMENGRYRTTSGKWAAMLREMMCEPIDVDGVPYGNRFWAGKRRLVNDTDKAEAKRHFGAVGERYTRPGWIADLVVEVGVPSSGKGSELVIVVSGYDRMERAPRSSLLPASGVF